MNVEVSRSALRALEIFEVFRSARRPLSLSEAARMANMPISTCHGVFKALEQQGFLYIHASRDAYPTRRLLDVAQEINAHDPVGPRLERALSELRDRVNETVVFGVQQGSEILNLLVFESAHEIRYSSRVGDRRCVRSNAVGKVMLTALETEGQVASSAVNDHPVERGRKTRPRVHGYYATREERLQGLMGIAAPLRVGTSMYVAAIVGPLERMALREASLGRTLCAALRLIERLDPFTRDRSRLQPEGATTAEYPTCGQLGS